MKLKKVINLLGGPNSGKSTFAAKLFNNMKERNYNVEYVTEFAKDLIWDGHFDIINGDQLYIFTHQHRRILRLKDQVEYIINDSPLILSPIYFNHHKNIYNYDIFNKLVLSTFNYYPNFNIFINRNLDFMYFNEGRKETISEVQEIDKKILKYLNDNDIYFSIEYSVDTPKNWLSLF